MSLSLQIGGLNLGAQAGGAGTPPPVYDPDVVAYAAAVATAGGSVSDARKALLTTFVAGLKTDGVWTLIDRLGIFAAEDQAGAVVDLKQPTKSVLPQSSPTFAANLGFTGDGVTSYIDAGEVPNAAGNAFSLNSASAFIYENTPSAGTAVQRTIGVSGTASAATTRISAAGAGVNNTYQINDPTATNITGTLIGAPTTAGFRLVSRLASTGRQLYFNPPSATAQATSAIASTAIQTMNPTYLRLATFYATSRIAVAGWGQGMTDTNAYNFYNRLLTFLTAIGAN